MSRYILIKSKLKKKNIFELCRSINPEKIHLISKERNQKAIKRKRITVISTNLASSPYTKKKKLSRNIKLLKVKITQISYNLWWVVLRIKIEKNQSIQYLRALNQRLINYDRIGFYICDVCQASVKIYFEKSKRTSILLL